ncbi:hypothetical protein ACROYT_G039117 [Oculina patagonica]
MFLTSYTVAIVTSDAMEMTTTCSAMIGHLFDFIIAAANDRFVVLTHQCHCRTLRFTSAPIDGYRLKNHVIRTIGVISEDICEIQCYLEPNCVSYNYKKMDEANGGHKCDLNNATYEHDNEHAGDLEIRENYVYRGAKNACAKKPCKNQATCQAGFTDRDYHCLCLPGFTGHDCEVVSSATVASTSDDTIAASDTVTSPPTTSKEPKTEEPKAASSTPPYSTHMTILYTSAIQEITTASEKATPMSTAGKSSAISSSASVAVIVTKAQKLTVVRSATVASTSHDTIATSDTVTSPPPTSKEPTTEEPKTGCQEALGMESGGIKDAQISASSEWRANHASTLGRLHFKQTGNKQGAWSAGRNDANQWLQIDLIGQYKVTRVATQGRNGHDQWVTKYKLQYGDDGKNFKYYQEPGNNADKEFDGNSNRDTVVYQDLNPPITARYIRFVPVAWLQHISMRAELYGCLKGCKDALGMASGAITNEQITASSEHSDNHTAMQARLNFKATGNNTGAWVANASDVNQWLQIDLIGQYIVTRVATQGRNEHDQWVTQYKLQYGGDRKNFQYYKKPGNNAEKTFAGNTDQNTIVYRKLNPPIIARYIRFVPVSWNGNISMRVELFGCKQEVDQCTNGKHSCDVNAVCNNTRGSYNCTCKDGFYGDGKNCTDIDECSTNFHSCKAGFEENCAAISVPEPIALYPLNSKYETREINNQQPQGTPVGVSLATGPDGKPGGSYQFAGHASSYIEFPNSGGLHVKHSITMLCWVYLETPYASGPLFNYGLIVFWGVHFRISYGKLVAHFKDSADEPLTTTQSLAAKQWYYVGSSYDHNTGNASLWLNGTRVVHKKIGADITLATGHEVRMGARANPDDPRYFMGRITAMQVYDVALTAEHINEVKDAGQDSWHICDVNAVCNNTRGSYNCTCKDGFYGDGKTCDECQEALGMESGLITDQQITASSERNANHAAIQGRLHNTREHGDWTADENDANQWLQIDLIGQYIVTRVATQGSNEHDQWVTKYKLQYGDDSDNFQYYRTQGQTTDKPENNSNSLPVEAAPDIPATAATGTPITIPTPVSEVATAPEDRAAVTAPRQTTE